VVLLSNVVKQEMAEQGMKPISYAFKEIRLADLNELSKATKVESQRFRA